MRMKILSLLAALVTPQVIFGAEAVTYPLGNLEDASESATVIDVQGEFRRDVIAGTLQVSATGSPTACAYALEARLGGAPTHEFVEIGRVDCTAPAAISFYGISFDYIRGRLISLNGGDSPKVTAYLKVVSQ